MSQTDNDLSGLLRDHFERLEESYSKVAERSWVDVAYLHRLVHGGKQHPSRDTVIKLGLGLRLSVAQLDEILMAAGHAPLVRFSYAPRRDR
jgi:hypothetical protein